MIQAMGIRLSLQPPVLYVLSVFQSKMRVVS